MIQIAKVLFYFVLLSLVNLTLGYADIHEIRSIHEVKNSTIKNTVYFFDVDNTLLAPKGNKGSEAWFTFVWTLFKNSIHSESAFVNALDLWIQTQGQITVEPVEADGPKRIAELISSNHAVIGLSLRSLRLALLTGEQLRRINIELKGPSKNFVFSSGVGQNQANDVGFQGGVIFSSGNAKGLILKKFLSHLNWHPENLVFVDDKRAHLESVEKACVELGIQFTGYRYGALDNKIAAFEKKISSQWNNGDSAFLLDLLQRED